MSNPSQAHGLPTAALPDARWTAEGLCIPTPAVTAATTCGEVLNLFATREDLPAIAVILPLGGFGLADRMAFLSTLARPYRKELYERRSVTELMDPEPLVIDAELGIEKIVHFITEHKPHALQTGYIIVRDRTYLGLGTGLDLMQRMNERMAATLIELRESQAKLLASEKMAALGGLVAGVAHEINTPIGIARTAASHLQEQTAAINRQMAAGQIRKSVLQQYLAEADEATRLLLTNTNRAADLIRSFKQVAVDQTSDQPRRIVVRRYLDEILLNIRPKLKKTPHQVSIDCPDDLSMLTYPGDLAQIITNLLVNSLAHGLAEHPGGEIVIRASLLPQAQTRIIYEDNGCGIPEAIRPRVFEPFFTTRRGTGGSGLGLHIVYNLVTQRLGGEIELDSRVGQYTRFTITCPCLDAQLDPERSRV